MTGNYMLFDKLPTEHRRKFLIGAFCILPILLLAGLAAGLFVSKLMFGDRLDMKGMVIVSLTIILIIYISILRSAYKKFSS